MSGPNGYQQLVADAAAALDARLRADTLAGLHPTLYMYHRPSGPQSWGELAFSEDSPGPEWQLSSGERFPLNLEYGEGTRAWIARRAGNLPLLPFGEATR